MKSSNVLSGVFGAVLMAFATQTALAAPITYNSQAAYLAAIGGSADVTENFNAFVADQPFRNSSFDVGPFTLSSSGTSQNLNTQNTVDASPFSFGTFADVNGTTFAHFFISGGATTASIDFDMPIVGFGATFKELSNSTTISFTTQSGAKILTPGIGEGVAFFGFTLDPGETLTSFTFSRPSGGDGFGMDDVLLAKQSIPEPGTLALFGLGLAGLAFARRRKVA